MGQPYAAGTEAYNDSHACVRLPLGLLFARPPMMSNRELWQNALVQIELGTSEASFRTWFRNTAIVSRDGNAVQIAVPSKIVKEWLMDKHHKLILAHLYRASGEWEKARKAADENKEHRL